MKVLVTGAKGFVGQNLRVALKREPSVEVVSFDLNDPQTVLENALAVSDVIIHLAGVNRPERSEEYESGNAGFTKHLCDRLISIGRSPHILFASSTQATLSNPYGLSKRKAEETLMSYARETQAAVSIFRLTNVFGKWCRPDYNSVVATFCHHIARNESISISDPARELELVYIDDVVSAFMAAVSVRDSVLTYRSVDPVYRITLGALADLVLGFRKSRETLVLPDMADGFIRKLYATYLSYLPERDFACRLEEKKDARGELAEVLKSPHAGQFFISRTRPGITRGHHYHDTKIEKFIIVSGEAVIRFRKIESEAGSRFKVQGSSDEENGDQRSEVRDQKSEVIEYSVRGEEFRVVDIPPGYTHSIENVGECDLVVLFWAGEIFDPERPDTFAEIV